ncbi:MAG TPA: glycosyl transferase [Nitrobacter sp.]|nr:glycosyl transferase [Nitrobacter sp.]
MITIVAASAVLSAGLTCAIHPLLVRYALARPNARSSHTIPTPQGAGITVVLAALAVATVAAALISPASLGTVATTAAIAILLGLIGAIDDLRPIAVTPRLTFQTLAVAALVLAAPYDLRIVPAVPIWIERTLLVIAGVWFVNLVNFMDGLDWMTVAEVVPITSAIVLLGLLNRQTIPANLIAAALGGALIGFAPFNRPVAKVFLGDVGSLPIGLLLGWCLLQLTYQHHAAAAILLPLYYLADSTITLLRRMVGGEAFWQAHRQHYYQRATDNGWTVTAVVARVFSLNIGLAALALLSAWLTSAVADFILIAVGAGAVMRVLMAFSTPRK